MNDIRWGRIGGLNLAVAPSAVIASVLSWTILAAIAYWLLGLGPAEALVGAALGLAIHWSLVVAHHLGHVCTASWTGYPMVGIRFWAVMAADQYPPDEPELPAAVHLRRVMGGPVVTLTLVVLLSLGALAWRSTAGLPGWMVMWAWLDSVLLGVGELLPLGFTDGDTILYWWRRR